MGSRCQPLLRESISLLGRHWRLLDLVELDRVRVLMFHRQGPERSQVLFKRPVALSVSFEKSFHERVQVFICFQSFQVISFCQRK